MFLCYGHMPMYQSEFILMTGTYVTNWYELKSQASLNKLVLTQQNDPVLCISQKFHDWEPNKRGSED